MISDHEDSISVEQQIQLLDKNWKYSYEIIFSRMFHVKYSLFVGYLVLVVIWGLITWIIDVIYGGSQYLIDWWIYYVIFCVFIGSPIVLLQLAKVRLMASLPYMVQLLSDHETKSAFIKAVALMGSYRGSFYLSITFGLIGFVVILIQQVSQLPSIFKLYTSVWTLIALFFSGHGLWLALSSLNIARFLCAQKLQLEFLNPAKTLGIRYFASIMAYYATLFALQVLIWEIPYFSIVLTASTRLPYWTFDNVKAFLTASFFIIFVVFVLFYFLYPQMMINSTVERVKGDHLRGIQKRVHDIYLSNELPECDRVSLIKEYLDIYKEIESYKGTLPIQNLVGFTASFTATLALSLAGNIQAVLNLGVP